MLQRSLLLLALFAVAGCSRAVTPSDSAPRYVAPILPASILVVTDRVANRAFAPAHARRVANALRHFTPNTSWAFVDEITPAQIASAGAVVYLGDNGALPIASSALQAFRSAKVLVLTRFHLHQFHDAGFAFTHVVEGQDRRATSRLAVVRFASASAVLSQGDYVDVHLANPARATAFLQDGHRLVPFIVRDGNATFVNGTIDFDHLEKRPGGFAAAVLVADALNDALQAQPVEPLHLAMLRLEDVSVQTQALRLRGIVEYLAAQGVPYGISVIPDQWIAGRQLSTLREDQPLVDVLKFAQAHGATIILHGLHHSYHSPEDFEFWDQAHHRPLPRDSAPWMDKVVAQGYAIEEALGLHPRVWETPHYSASATDYREISKFFRIAWEERPPNGWLPWPLQRDEFGVQLLPENLGYVANDGSTTVSDQLATAKVLLACRGCIAAGFLHPATIPLDDFRRYVSGLRALGYRFADPGQFAQ